MHQLCDPGLGGRHLQNRHGANLADPACQPADPSLHGPADPRRNYIWFVANYTDTRVFDLEIIAFTDVHEDDVSVLEQLVIDAMEKSMRLRVPMVVHVSHGQRWGKLDAPSGDSKDDQPDTIHSDE